MRKTWITSVERAWKRQGGEEVRTRSQAQEVGLAEEICLLPCYAKRLVFLTKTLLEGP